MSNFNIRKFLTENKLTQTSRRTNEEKRSVEITNTDWSNTMSPVVTIDGKEYTLEFYDAEPTNDPGESNYWVSFTSPEFPNLEFRHPLVKVGDNFETYYSDAENDWVINDIR